MARLLTVVALCAIVVGGSSCGIYAEAVADPLADLIEKTAIGYLAHVGMTVGATAEAFCVDRGRWPENRDELVTFCRENGWMNLGAHLERYEDISFETADERLVQVKYAYGADQSEGISVEFSGTIELGQLCSEQEDTQELMELLHEIDDTLAKTRRAAPDWLTRGSGT